ncbi:hypothetical protein KAFR_0A07550 [Kazachstania africana CBS 2517]|uniref:Pre-rRNA-processing protein IPI3 n=1 Tax=Kazachstania africana (strain ATCC 22294 / BCRC 22015 / CBS 2517 / CECT 1963 / NBRC 1671 / NRRL Y-8276) TaxID=1071382 RepID=H2AP89_KAZAF|nr:hypothetical protein KAFR_0A07550 [Kazachstania africana CBS 2517]CCF56189.1 hypothetical protein KAFR_0A07550 [Kazachstania africana CBS 2517]
MDEQIIFTTQGTGTVGNIHSFEQANLRTCTTNHRNSAVQINDKYLFVAQAKKALINVYNLSGPNKRESVEQRLPLPEAVNCLEIVENEIPIYSNRNTSNVYNYPEFNLPYLLLASTESGKLYAWELNSGNLLNVKSMAHYQAITKIKSIMNGRYIITSGNDARIIIWQTVDLVSQEDPKPIAIIHDHTLPITDFEVSSTHGESLFSSGTKLYTASDDSTVKCYELNLYGSNNKKVGNKPRLLASFSLPFAANYITLDPAERSIYLGTKFGCYSLSLYYNLESKKIVNLTQLSDSNKGKIYSLIFDEEKASSKNELFIRGQLVIERLMETEVSCLSISMDGTILLVGDTMGNVSVVEVFSKQILKTLHPLTTSQVTSGAVTNILAKAAYQDENEALIGFSKDVQKSNDQKLPSLQRAIFDAKKPGQMHDVWHQIGPREGGSNSGMVTPLNNLDQYLDNVMKQESHFVMIGQKIVSEERIVNKETQVDASKDEEIKELKQNIQVLTKAYKELRDIHEKYYEEHEKVKKK